MSGINITMNASPEQPGKHTDDITLSFDPKTLPVEPKGETVTFKVAQSLLNYIEAKAYTVTLIWQGETHLLTDGSDLTFDLDHEGTFHYTLKLVEGEEQALSKDPAPMAAMAQPLRANASTTEGEIIVR